MIEQIFSPAVSAGYHPWNSLKMSNVTEGSNPSLPANLLV